MDTERQVGKGAEQKKGGSCNGIERCKGGGETGGGGKMLEKSKEVRGGASGGNSAYPSTSIDAISRGITLKNWEKGGNSGRLQDSQGGNAINTPEIDEQCLK